MFKKYLERIKVCKEIKLSEMGVNQDNQPDGTKEVQPESQVKTSSKAPEFKEPEPVKLVQPHDPKGQKRSVSPSSRIKSPVLSTTHIPHSQSYPTWLCPTSPWWTKSSTIQRGPSPRKAIITEASDQRSPPPPTSSCTITSWPLTVCSKAWRPTESLPGHPHIHWHPRMPCWHGKVLGW